MIPDKRAALADAGWSVAVHNDYRLNGKQMTFWLFTHPSGRYVKGEGHTDDEAISVAWEAVDALRHSAPQAEPSADLGIYGPREACGVCGNVEYPHANSVVYPDEDRQHVNYKCSKCGNGWSSVFRPVQGANVPAAADILPQAEPSAEDVGRAAHAVDQRLHDVASPARTAIIAETIRLALSPGGAVKP